EHLDFDPARHLAGHAAGVAEAVRVPRQVDRDLERDLLRGVDLVEVHVMMSGRSGWRWISRISVFTVLPSTASSMMVLSGSTPWSAFSSALASTSSDWVSRPWP